jgi:hypothetical protein
MILDVALAATDASFWRQLPRPTPFARASVFHRNLTFSIGNIRLIFENSLTGRRQLGTGTDEKAPARPAPSARSARR